MNPSRRSFLRRGLAAAAIATIALRDDAVARVRAAGRRTADRTPEELARDEDFWFEVQQAFDLDRSFIYLNNGGISPSPRIVLETMRRYQEFSNHGPARNMWRLLDPQIETVRARLARSFGCSTEELAITRNTTEAMEICLYGLDLKAGDEVLTTDQDYPRMLNTLKQRELREGIVLRKVPVPAPVQDLAELVEPFARNITPQTRMILCCHMVNLTGQIFPVRDICRLAHQHDIPVVVDGAHAYAQLDFRRDDLECDYYGTSLHKWLTAPLGTGFLYVRQDRIQPLWPLMAAPEPRSQDIRKFEEIGTHPSAPFLAIAEALTFHEAIGVQRKAARLRYLRDYWAGRLMQDRRVKFFARLEPEHSCGLATFAIEGIEPARLVEHLWNQHRIYVIPIDHETVKGVRVTPNVFTTLEELDMFCQAVEDVLANGLP